VALLRKARLVLQPSLVEGWSSIVEGKTRRARSSFARVTPPISPTGWRPHWRPPTSPTRPRRSVCSAAGWRPMLARLWRLRVRRRGANSYRSRG
jgi:hypothetical protein